MNAIDDPDAPRFVRRDAPDRSHVLFDWSVFSVHISVFMSVAVHGTSSSRLPPHFPPSFPLFTQCNGCLPSLLRGGSWLACQDLPAMGAVSI